MSVDKVPEMAEGIDAIKKMASDIYSLQVTMSIMVVVVFVMLASLMFAYTKTNHFQNMKFSYTNNKHHDLQQLLVPRMTVHEQSDEPCSYEQGSDEPDELELKLVSKDSLQYTNIKKGTKQRRYGSMFAVGSDHDSDQVDVLLNRLQNADRGDNSEYLAGFLN